LTFLTALVALAAGWSFLRLRDQRTISWAGGCAISRASVSAGTILFVRAHRLGDYDGIFSMGSDGRGWRKLPAAGLDAALSPDGGRVVFVGWDNRTLAWHLHRADANGANDRTLTPAWLDGSSPSWSRNGRQIAFTGMRWGRRHYGKRDFLGMDVWVVDADGGHLRRLRPGMRPAWSPDGQTILYAVWDPTPEDEHTSALRAMDPDGSHPRLLVRGTRGQAWAREAAWSPDGRQIAYTARLGRDEMGIWVMDADGSHRRLLTHGAEAYVGPVWLPDGIAFTRVAYRDLQPSIWIMDADGRNPRLLTRNGQTSDGMAFILSGWLGGA
jgi:Tol biopolymer transport system component